MTPHAYREDTGDSFTYVWRSWVVPPKPLPDKATMDWLLAVAHAKGRLRRN